jgi:transposase
VKVHLAVDTGGLPHAIKVTSAEVTDREGAVYMLRRCALTRSEVWKQLNATNRKGGLPHPFVVLPKRWVVERSFAWLETYRRLWKNCERKLHNTLQMTTLAFISLLLKRY